MERVKSFIINHVLVCILLALPYGIMDAVIRITSNEIKYNRKGVLRGSILFDIAFIVFIVLFCHILDGIKGRTVYLLITGVYSIMFLTNLIYYALTNYFFSFRLVFMASEGSEYILSTIKASKLYVWVAFLFIIALIIIGAFVIGFKGKADIDKKVKGIILTALTVLFIALQFIIPISYGKGTNALKWDNFRRPKVVYNEFSDPNKCMKLCGFFKYVERDFVKTFFGKEKGLSKEEEKFLEDEYASKVIHKDNEYTGLFEGKNVIFLQLEGIDSWLLTKEDMPNLYGLRSESIDFSNHYSYYNGGGSTFNSEFAINTGFITPISYSRNAYTFSGNIWTDTLPKIFADKGYSTNCYHMNSQEYYSRGINYASWGYDNYFGLCDITDDEKRILDTELFLNKEFYDLFFNTDKDKKFLKYLITYTPHTPFTTTDDTGKLLAQKNFPDGNVPDMSEEEVARMMAKETDDMVGLLIEGLKDNGLLDDTVIVAYADHYLYTINDKSVLDKYKETSDNRINNTPFFIWSNDLSANAMAFTSDKVNSQLDILPTMLNLFGVKYDENRYIGRDILSNDYEGYAFFDDYSWLSGDVYYNDGNITMIGNGNIDEEKIYSINAEINKLIKKNDLTLKADYFKK